jgi:hypothetical protein
MPDYYQNSDSIDTPVLEEEISVSWIGNEIAFNIGETPIKIWQLLAGIIFLAIIVPLFFTGSSSPAPARQGITIINKTNSSSNKAPTKRRSSTKRTKRRQIKSITYK